MKDYSTLFVRYTVYTLCPENSFYWEKRLTKIHNQVFVSLTCSHCDVENPPVTFLSWYFKYGVDKDQDTGFHSVYHDLLAFKLCLIIYNRVIFQFLWLWNWSSYYIDTDKQTN